MLTVIWRGKAVGVKISNILKVIGLIITTFNPSVVQKHTRLKMYNTLAVLTLVWE